MASRSSQLLHCVLICGIEATTSHGTPAQESLLVNPYNRERYIPKLLDVHPPEAETPAMIEQFCLPSGVELIRNDFSKAIDRSPVFFPFILTNVDGSHMYGGSLIFLDPIEGTGFRATKSIAVLSAYPMYAAFREIVTYLHDVVHKGGSSSPFLRHLDYVIRDVPLPLPGGSRVQVTLRNRSVILKRPAIGHLSLLDVPLYSVFKHINTESLLNTFKHLILEHKVMLISSDLDCLGIVAESLCSLMAPLKWHHVCIPILPNFPHFIDYLAAPVPFLIGVHISSHAVRNHPPDVSVVDLDTGNIHSAVSSEGLPELPKSPRRQLKKKLKDLLAPIDFTKDTCPSFPTQAVRMAFFQFFAECFYDYREHARGKEGLEFDFDNDKMIASRPEVDRAFFQQSTQTQIFHTFVLESTNPSDSYRSEMVLFDETIKQFRTRKKGFGFFTKIAPKTLLEEMQKSLEKIQKSFDSETSAEVIPVMSTDHTARTIIIHEPSSMQSSCRYNYMSVPRLRSFEHPGVGGTINSSSSTLASTLNMSFFTKPENDLNRTWGRVLRALQSLSNSTSYSTPEMYVEMHAPFHIPVHSMAEGNSYLEDPATAPNPRETGPNAPSVTFPTSSICNGCGHGNPIFNEAFANSHGYQIKCEKCSTHYVPMVEIIRNSIRSYAEDGGEGQPVVIWQGYVLSAHNLSKEVSALTRQGVVPDATFPKEHPTTFWNMVMYLRRQPQPLSYFMPSIIWNDIL